MLFAVKILLTIVTLGYSAVPAFFDSNQTHATNPSWDGHARFHVVWQVSSYVYIAVLALYLIWTAGQETWPLWLATLMAAAAYGGFWTAVISRPAYGGTLVSKEYPVPNFNWNIGGKQFETDANVTLFAPLAALVLVCAVLMLS
jgi:uncharacterized membrane protein YecN with MAPEG domain